MSNGMFLIQNDGRLIEMDEQAYPSEDYLQKLLAQYPKSGRHSKMKRIVWN